jgi:hypothetical protein
MAGLARTFVRVPRGLAGLRPRFLTHRPESAPTAGDVSTDRR